MLAFLHIPKTAGTSFGIALHHTYGSVVHEFGNAFSRADEVEPAPAGCQAAEGHVTLGTLDRIAPGATLATVLREPVERTLSQHRYLAAGRGRGFVPRGKPEPPVGISLRAALDGGYVLDNLQTRMLCGIDLPYDPLPSDALERATANLSRFAYLGVMERFDEFLALVAIGLSWPTIAPFQARVNEPESEADPEDVRLAAAANELDAALYPRAALVASKAAEEAGEALAEELAVMRAGEGATARSLPFEARVELARKERDLALMHDKLRKLERKLKLRRLRAKREAKREARREKG
jgi:hypothetical protein